MNIKKLKEENKKLIEENEALKQIVNSREENEAFRQNNVKKFESESFNIRKDHENIFAWFAISKTNECYIIPDEDRNFVCIDIPTLSFHEFWKYLDGGFDTDELYEFPTFILDLDELKCDYDIVVLNSNVLCNGVYKIQKINKDEYTIIPQTLIVDNENSRIEVEDE